MGPVGDFLDLFLNETSVLFIDLMYKKNTGLVGIFSLTCGAAG